MRGITLATDSTNADVIFLFLSPYLEEILILLQKYANCPELVELIIELFVDVVQTEIVYLDKVLFLLILIYEVFGSVFHESARYLKY